MEIRPLTHDDLPSVCRVYRLTNQNERRGGDAAPPSPDVILDEDLWIWEHTILVGTTYVAVIGERIIGFVHWSEPGHITLLEVLPEKGWEDWAYQLVRFAEGTFVEAGLKDWTAHVNQPMRVLLEQDGFRMVRTEWIRMNDLQTLRSLMIYGSGSHFHFFQEVEPQTFIQRQVVRLHPRGNVLAVVVIGVIIPMILLAIDPGLFSGDGMGSGLETSRYRAFVYVSAAVAALNLLGAVFVPEMVGALRAGIFFGSGLLVFPIALGVTPFTVIGMFYFGIGVLGLLPWLVAWLYHRLGQWALEEERRRSGDAKVPRAPILCGMVLAWLPGFGAQRACEARVNWHIAQIEKGGEAEVDAAVRELGFLYWLHSPINMRFYRDPDGVTPKDVSERLDKAYDLILEANEVNRW